MEPRGSGPRRRAHAEQAPEQPPRGRRVPEREQGGRGSSVEAAEARRAVLRVTGGYWLLGTGQVVPPCLGLGLVLCVYARAAVLCILYVILGPKRSYK